MYFVASHVWTSGGIPGQTDHSCYSAITAIVIASIATAGIASIATSAVAGITTCIIAGRIATESINATTLSATPSSAASENKKGQCKNN